MPIDENFFKKLDEALTNVGTDKYWERKIGGHNVWISLVPMKSQQKVNEIMNNAKELNLTVIGDIQRTALSFAIVGFDGIDLRKYRDGSPVFPVYNVHEKKTYNVSLDRYLYTKMGEWGTEWIESAFAVFSDITETVKKENVKDVKFENLKTKKEELLELEAQVAALRQELEMPQLVEFDENRDVSSFNKDLQNKIKEESKKLNEENESESERPRFNPFQRIPEKAEEIAGPPIPSVPSVSTLVPSSVPQKVNAGAFTGSIDDLTSGSPTSTKDNPHIIGSSEILDKRSDKVPLPVVINPVQQNINPRFKRVR
jgi:hypothetical protein